MDLIDEDSLLTEEDLKKPQLPPGKMEDPKLIFLIKISYGILGLALTKFVVKLVIVKLEAQEKLAKTAFVGELKQRRK